MIKSALTQFVNSVIDENVQSDDVERFQSTLFIVDQMERQIMDESSYEPYQKWIKQHFCFTMKNRIV